MEQNLSVSAKRIERLTGVKTGAHSGLSSSQSPSLEKGDSFTANIKDIKPNQVVLTLPGGKELNARTGAMPEARIGDDAVFQVKESFKGQVLLEMLKSDKILPHAGIAREALLAADLPLSAENFFLLERMIAENLPIAAENLNKALFFRYAGEGLDLDTVVFLLKENFPADFETVETLERFLSQQVKTGRDLCLAVDDISRLGDGEMKAELLAVMGKEILDIAEAENPAMAERLKTAVSTLEKHPRWGGQVLAAVSREASDLIKKVLSRGCESPDRPEPVKPGEINAFYKAAVKMLGELSEAAERMFANPSAEADASVLLQLTERITRNLENIRFMNQIQETKQFFQLPFTVSAFAGTAEVHVYQGKKKTAEGHASALLSLSFPELGLVETFMNLTGRTLTFDFGAADEGVLKLIKSNRRTLYNMLAEKGYAIGRISFGVKDKPIKLTESPERQNAEAGRKYSFDMRV